MATNKPAASFFFAAMLLSSISLFGQMINNAWGGDGSNAWSSLSLDAISSRGKFVAFRLKYQDNADTLFVKNSGNGNVLAFPAGKNACFAAEQFFACTIRNEGVILADLKNKSRKVFPHSEYFSFTADASHIAVFTAGSDTGLLNIQELASANQLAFKEVSEWAMDPLQKRIAVASQGKFWLVEPGKIIAKKNIASLPAGNFSNIAWHQNGRSVAFYGKESEKLFHYDIFSGKLSEIRASLYGPLHISPDQAHVYFGKPKPALKIAASPTPAEVWNTKDIHIFPEREQLGDPASQPDIAAWNIKTGIVQEIGDVGSSFIFTTAGLLFTQFSEIGDQGIMSQQRDFYTADPNTGKRYMWLGAHGASLDRLAIDPAGRYAAYEKEKEIFAFDFNKREHLPIGQGSIVEWSEKNGKLLFLLDGDVWEAAPGKKKKRIAFAGARDVTLAPNIASVYEAVSKDGSLAGYYKTDKGGNAYPLAFGEFNASQLLLADSENAYAYVRQRFDSPPEIIHGNLGQTQAISVYKSNSHFKKYEWGRAERISYLGTQGKPLSGVLVYPAGYDPEKTYPMVVHIYEAQARHLHLFSSPSLRNYSGFNASLLANSGYFVLRPDIVFAKEQFDISMVACVSAAVKEACLVAPIDPKRIGLMGHSFGGTQASLLAAKTDIFAAVIAGAGNSNFTSRYLSWSANHRKTEYWRFESGQNFMAGKGLFDDIEAYVKNSSALMAKSITAPMLVWTGSDDRQVAPVDSEALYLALRRLGKTGIMLKYKGEQHALMGIPAQEDLTLKVMDWFGHYLKGEESKKWMVPNKD